MSTQTSSSQKPLSQDKSRASQIENAIQGFSQFTPEYRLGKYKQFGHGRYSYELARDLLKFREEFMASEDDSELCFWAVFEQSDSLSEAEFEKCLMKELSYAATHPEFSSELELQFGSNPDDEKFYFMLDGTMFSVTGLHPHSAQPSRRFPHPTLIFNIHTEMQEIPAVSKDSWQAKAFMSLEEPSAAIQLSGREKAIDWKFPLA